MISKAILFCCFAANCFILVSLHKLKCPLQCAQPCCRRGGVIHVGWPLKQEKRGNRKSQETGESKASQETGKIRHRGKSGNAKSLGTGQVRKREETLKP